VPGLDLGVSGVVDNPISFLGTSVWAFFFGPSFSLTFNEGMNAHLSSSSSTGYAENSRFSAKGGEMNGFLILFLPPSGGGFVVVYWFSLSGGISLPFCRAGLWGATRTWLEGKAVSSNLVVGLLSFWFSPSDSSFFFSFFPQKLFCSDG